MEAACFPSPKGTASSGGDAQADSRTSPSGTSKKKRRPPTPKKAEDCGPSPKRTSLQRLNPDIGKASTSFDVSLGQLPSQRVSRPSLCRRSMKQDRRTSLPPLHADVTELSKAISLDLPEKDRMAQLLLSSFRYAAQKFKDTLKHTKGFNAETFERKANEISEELRFCTKRLDLDGTLQKCFEEPKGDSSVPVLSTSLTTLKENIARLTEENQAWDRLLWSYQRRAEEISSQLQQCKLRVAPEEPVSYLGSSQAHVLQAKPDYQKILDSQGTLFESMELVLDEIHQAVNVFQAFMEDDTHRLQKLSEQLGSRTFQGLENSPARKLLMLPQALPSVP
ncbi:PREDICTED: kinetochore-associated protein DSN1 homolog [Gekko japonicus]|uniref:Kinetochore-associated protein DSN1 homolog n=1 Tax=Gekko japonicus TaxID=146911 RepID=A0ABM1LBB4_GEKJA|nr:PREDICTED: kinetochore-associated protein DSN1 homolog [Gekko japonicus]XP_015283252.1 PREDICTED: kinetochore-associated protein DSN1 homolog [Gekko japonicus]